MIDEPAEIVDYVHKNEFINAKRFPVAVNWGINSGDNQGLCKTITRNRQNLHFKKIHTSTSACYYTLRKLSCLERYTTRTLYEKARDVPRSKLVVIR